MKLFLSTPSHRLHLLILSGLMMFPGCSENPSSSPPPPAQKTETTHSKSLNNVARLTAAPLPDDLQSLDPSAAALIRQVSDALNQAIYRPDLWAQLGVVYHAHRRFSLAKTCYVQHLVRDDNSAKTWYYLSLIEDQLGGSDAAIDAVERSIAHNSGYPPAHWRRGFWMLDRGELEEAERSFRAALAIAPHDAASSVGLARVHLQQDRVDDAIARLKEHLERMPRDGNARYLLGTAYRKAGRLEEAKQALAAGSGGDRVQHDPWRDEMIAYRKGFRTDFNRAMGLLRAGKITDSIALFESLHERQPQDTLIHINLHRAYRINGELVRAISLLKEAEEIRPLSDMIQFHLAGAYRDLARRAGTEPDLIELEIARAHAEKACALSPTYAMALGLHGDILNDLGHNEEATDAYLRAAQLDRNSLMWQGKASWALCQANRWKEAILILERLDALQPDTPRTLFLLSAALANSGRLDDAKPVLKRAKTLAPNNPRILKAWEDLGASLRERDQAATASSVGTDDG